MLLLSCSLMGPNRNRDINDISQWADIPPKGSKMQFEGYEITGYDTTYYNWKIEFDSVRVTDYYWDYEGIVEYKNQIDTVHSYCFYVIQKHTNDIDYMLSGDFINFGDRILQTPVESDQEMWCSWYKYKIRDIDCGLDTPAGHFGGLVRMDIMVYATLIGTMYYSPQHSHVIYCSFDASQFWEWQQHYEVTGIDW